MGTKFPAVSSYRLDHNDETNVRGTAGPGTKAALMV
jgi:hypothetical protein